MNRDQIEKALDKAKALFLSREGYLLTANVNERSLTHKFAEHLQAVVGGGWCVDCEYNRYGVDSTKILEEVKQIVGEYASTDETKARTVYPDVIIHRRGPEGPNLLVIEAKKNASKAERVDDWKKLHRIKDQYEYTFAAFINFVTAKARIESELRE